MCTTCPVLWIKINCFSYFFFKFFMTWMRYLASLHSTLPTLYSMAFGTELVLKKWFENCWQNMYLDRRHLRSAVASHSSSVFQQENRSVCNLADAYIVLESKSNIKVSLNETSQFLIVLSFRFLDCIISLYINTWLIWSLKWWNSVLLWSSGIGKQ